MPRRNTTVDGQPTPRRTSADPSIGQVRSMLAEAQALSTQFATFNEVAATTQGVLDTTAMLQTMATQARWVLDFQFCSIVLAEHSACCVQILTSASGKQAGHTTHPITPAIQRALEHGHVQLLHDVPPSEVVLESRYALILPLRDGDRVVGTLNFFPPTIVAIPKMICELRMRLLCKYRQCCKTVVCSRRLRGRVMSCIPS